jgi:hypothetical protein
MRFRLIHVSLYNLSFQGQLQYQHHMWILIARCCLNKTTQATVNPGVLSYSYWTMCNCSPQHRMLQCNPTLQPDASQISVPHKYVIIPGGRDQSTTRSESGVWWERGGVHEDLAYLLYYIIHIIYSASHSRVAPENVDLQKEQKCNTFVCYTCNEVLCVLGIRKKEVGNTKR